MSSPHCTDDEHRAVIFAWALGVGLVELALFCVVWGLL